MDRYVQLVAIGVLEMQELGFDAAGFQRNQTVVTTDAVFLVDDGLTWLKIIELPNDRLGIALALATTLSCLGPLTEQLLFADDGNVSAWQQHAIFDRCDGDTDSVLVIPECLPGFDSGQVQATARQHVKKLFAPARRICRKQDLAVEAVEELHQRGGRIIVASLYLHGWRQACIEVQVFAVARERLG